MKKILGYCDPWTAAPGERVRFMVGSYGAQEYRAQLVRIICGDDRPLGPAFKEEPIPSSIDGVYPARHQPIPLGSHVSVPDDPRFAGLESFSVQVFVWPTTPDKGEQGLVSRWSAADRCGFALLIDELGALALRVADGRGGEVCVSTPRPLPARVWSLVAASFDAATGEVKLVQRPLQVRHPEEDALEVTANTPLRGIGHCRAALLMAALPDAAEGRFTAHFNGKLDRPRLAKRVLSSAEMGEIRGDHLPPRLATDVLAAWDFSQDTSGERVVDFSANRLHGRTFNLPSRGVTGHNWTGAQFSWREAPAEYAAIHFHDDDLYDAGWQPDFELALPDELRSGVYAVRLEADADVSYMVFFVRPPRGRTTARVAFLASTATYLAYANYQWMLHEPLAELKRSSVLVLDREDAFLQAHPELGLSTYDTHSDGSGVRYSSRLRPLLNVSPRTDVWSFNADTHVLDWLEASGHAYDVINDDDLHAEGVSLLAAYPVVVTGSHPEYWSTAMKRALEAYLRGGGRLVYLGGNGFYWRIAFHATLPGVIEVRRTEDGARYWAEEPGEYHLSFSGEYGGLWRRIGEPPQALVGIGTRATGFDRSSFYRRTPASRDPRVAFVFEGIEGDEIIGDFGSLGGGASGIEIDAVDERLGTPPHALVVASSEDHSPEMFLAPEETNFHHTAMAGADNPHVRADLVFFECPQGGAVFSTGSIAWAASLAYDGYKNNVSRLTDNVLRRFLDETPF